MRMKELFGLFEGMGKKKLSDETGLVEAIICAVDWDSDDRFDIGDTVWIWESRSPCRVIGVDME